ncbi:DNA damage-regulated autophagy modulator protein 2-like isoform X1 [Saccoglossus kowalevskii]|uniref:DNA damage-regulated autophagy modulator protein 2-like n=1 Tax=Saccoglossus kowalevskii TaxID=10224 RepID=A0ABM0MNX9_SACKO|nr:PREDICTED: DNA damage-regulated autophagy modulator protein 2-like [Saccoglossus kowalevskii]
MCNPWFCVGMGWLPMSVGVMVMATFTISYSISVSLGHVPAEFPYISDTGTYVPESCIFGQLLNIAAALAFATMYVRYKNVIEYNHNEDSRVLLWNKIGLVMGSLAALGMSMVANFQESNVLVMHMVGANMCFGIGILYCYVHSWISYKMMPFHASHHEYMARIICSVVGSVSFIFTSIFAAVAQSKWEGEKPTKWSPEDGGFPEHIVSTVSEWILAVSFLLYFFTYIREFQKIRMEANIRLYTEDMMPINDPEV